MIMTNALYKQYTNDMQQYMLRTVYWYVQIMKHTYNNQLCGGGHIVRWTKSDYISKYIKSLSLLICQTFLYRIILSQEATITALHKVIVLISWCDSGES